MMFITEKERRREKRRILRNILCFSVIVLFILFIILERI